MRSTMCWPIHPHLCGTGLNITQLFRHFGSRVNTAYPDWINLFFERKYVSWMWTNIFVNENINLECEWCELIPCPWILHLSVNHSYHDQGKSFNSLSKLPYLSDTSQATTLLSSCSSLISLNRDTDVWHAVSPQALVLSWRPLSRTTIFSYQLSCLTSSVEFSCKKKG
jgi:hypothetical protein